MNAHATIVRQIVSRLHVGESNRAVIGYVASRIKGGRRAFLRLPRKSRRDIMRAAIKAHSDNRGLYRFVTGSIQP